METIEKKSKNIEYPYLPEGHCILYVPENNKFIQEAKMFAKENSLDKNVPTGAVLVFNETVIGRGANGSDYHDKNGCYRVKNNIPTGQDYELCEGCSPKNHAEPRAIKNATENGFLSNGADIYLWGHYWCCESCWGKMIESGIRNVYLMEGSEISFNKNNPDNIIGHQFD